MSQVDGRYVDTTIEHGRTRQPHPLQLITVKLGERQAWSFGTNLAPAEVSLLQSLPAVNAGSFSVVVTECVGAN